MKKDFKPDKEAAKLKPNLKITEEVPPEDGHPEMAAAEVASPAVAATGAAAPEMVTGAASSEKAATGVVSTGVADAREPRGSESADGQQESAALSAPQADANASASASASAFESGKVPPDTGAEKQAVPEADRQRSGKSRKLSDNELVLRYKTQRTISYVAAIVFIWALMAGPLMLGLALAWGPIKYAGSLGLACIGEKDWSYALTTTYPQLESGESSKVVKNRSDLIDAFIREQNSSNGQSVFSALGAEAMNLKYGDRARGFKYGDALIAKYPNLPANYFWRAQVDYESGNFAQSAEQAEQFLSLLSRSDVATRESWLADCNLAVYSRIYAGQETQAFEAVNKFEKLVKDTNARSSTPPDRFILTEVTSLKAPLYLQMYESLAPDELRKTNLWTDESEKTAQKWLAGAEDAVKQVGYSSLPELLYLKRRLSLQVLLLRGGTSGLGRQTSHRYYYELSLMAQDALARGNYQQAENLIKRIPVRFRTPSEILCLAKVYIKEGKFADAIEALDGPMDDSDTCLEQGQFYLTRSLIKAQAYYGLMDYNQALSYCDKVLASNPHMLEAYLVKIKCYDAQGNHRQSANEHELLKGALASLLKAGTPEKQ